MPIFTVIAGPNGAGKSTFSSQLSKRGAIIFDPDKIKLAIEHQYPDISEEALENAVTIRYKEYEHLALLSAENFTVETNLRNDFLAERALYFKDKGYSVRLFFMLLPDIGSSMDRVNLRVKKKGHFVDIESIRYNFEKSREVFFKVVSRFDEISLVSTVSNHGMGPSPLIILTVKSRAVIYINENTPPWAIPFVQSTISNIRRPTGPA